MIFICSRLHKYLNLTYNNIILIFIHTTLKARVIKSGKTYSWRVNNGDGSQSMIILPNFSLYSTGHTKYGY